MDERKIKEMEFHDSRERDRLALRRDDFEKKYSNKKWYSITRTSSDYLERWLKQNCKGRVALDYCCGLGRTSLKMAEYGAFVHGIDISEESVRTARNLLIEKGYASLSAFQVMDAEHLSFSDSSFDVIVCSGVLHHLDVLGAYRQLARVLKPTGKIICIEALGYNPLISLYRKLTPHLRTQWEAEHILTLKEVRSAQQYFDNVQVRFFHLFTIGAVLFRNTPLFSPVLSLFEAIDSVILQIPWIDRMAWQMIFELRQPVKESLT